MYLFDGLHPNHEGSSIVASKVIGFINSQVLKKAESNI